MLDILNNLAEYTIIKALQLRVSIVEGHTEIQLFVFMNCLQHVLIVFGPLLSFFCIFLVNILLGGLHNKSGNTKYQATSCLDLNLKLEPKSHMK